MIQILLPWLHLSFHSACPRYLKSRRDLLYVLIQNVPFSLWLRAWNKMTLFGLSTFKFNVPYQISLSFAIKGLKLNDLFRFFRFLCPLSKCPFPFTIKSLKWNDPFLVTPFLDGPYQNVPYQNVPCAKQCILFKSEIPSSVIRHLSFIFTRKEKKS